VILRRTLFQVLLLPLCWLLLVTALAAPQWVENPIEQIESARDLMLAVDLSGSMETRDFSGEGDVPVDRLTAVKTVLADFVSQRVTDRLGLILFGNAAFLQVPFTMDHETFATLLDEAQIRMAGPRTMLGDAVGLAIRVFEESEAEQRLLILLTDGNDTGSRIPPVKAAEIAATHGITIHVIGVGDPQAAGEAPLDEETLKQMASATGGRFFLASDSSKLENVYEEIDALEPQEFESFSYRPKRPLFHWPLGAALVLLMTYHLLMAGWSRVRRKGAAHA
jgi:Ca-activated chloride channel family protein